MILLIYIHKVVLLCVCKRILIIGDGIAQILIDGKLFFLLCHVGSDDPFDHPGNLLPDLFLLSCLNRGRFIISEMKDGSPSVKLILLQSQDQRVLIICLQKRILRKGQVSCLREIRKIDGGCSSQHGEGQIF